MTGPIAFTATPKDADTDNADAEDIFGQVATVTDANFAKINTYWLTTVPKLYQSTQVSTPTAWVQNAFTDYPSGNWPALAVPIPTNVSVVMVFCGTVLDSPANSGWFRVACRFSGAVANAPTAMALHIMADDGRREAYTPSLVLPKANLTPGGTLTITPQYYNGTGNGTAAGIQQYSGVLGAIVYT